MTSSSADDVRARIASAMLGDAAEIERIGDVTLHAHQRDGVRRIRQLLDQHGGALLADDVGMGKTYVALAVAARHASTLVAGPAAVRTNWLDASRRAGVRIRFVSIEALSRGTAVARGHDLVIVDEAHHLRSATTRRFAAVAELCRDAYVVLLSATPVQNRLSDMRTMLSLFLGERAHAMRIEELASVVVRRVENDMRDATLALPKVGVPAWLSVVDDADCLDRLLRLPPAVPPAGDGDAGILLTFTLARQWASSRAALVGALTRRLARARAMEDALSADRLPTRTELALWSLSEGFQQLSFPELVVSSVTPEAGALMEHVQRHGAGVRDLLAWLGGTPNPDHARAERLRELLQEHEGERIVAFSEYADTISALYQLLRASGRVAMMTHAGGRVVGGRIPRAELLERFSPGASARATSAGGIDLLLTTDVLSEGVNLQDASVIVHLDLAWNPARLEQRVGRLRRIGAARDVVRVYMFAPPAPAEHLLQLERRLRLKLDEAARAMGIAGAIMPGLTSSPGGAATREEGIDRVLRGWRRDATRGTEALAAAISSSRDGALVCVHVAGEPKLLAIVDGAVADDRQTVEALLQCADGPEVQCSMQELQQVRRLVLVWLRHRAVSGVVDLPALRVGRARQHVLHRVDDISRRVPRHVRPRLSRLMHSARAVATATLSAGAERVLSDLADARMPDEAWLNALGEFATLHARKSDDRDSEIMAVLLLAVASAAT